jgi:hypothetical protein
MALVPVMTHVSALTMKRLMLAAVLGAAILGAPAPSNAADLGIVRGARHFRHVERAWNWRDRCAWEGYYCLYAWDGYIYHYPWDDRRAAYDFVAPRRRHRF